MSRFTKLDAAGKPLSPEAAEPAAILDEQLNLEWSPTSIKVSSWEDAAEKVKALGDDWRMPTPEELFLLADRSKRNPSIDTAFFPDTKSDWYWAAYDRPANEQVVGWPDFAWYVLFSFGGVDGAGRSCGGFVGPVRSSRPRQS